MNWKEFLRALSAFPLEGDTRKVISSTTQDKERAFRHLLLRPTKADRTLSFALSIFFDPNADAAQSLQRARSADASTQGMLMHVINALSGGMLLLTAEDRFALGLCALQREYLICVFAELSMPVNVRPEGSSFTLVGSAYVDGVMDGEPWPDHADDLAGCEIV